MSDWTQRNLVSAYGLDLDLQISQRGSSLPCGDPELLEQVTAMLRDAPAQDMHRLGPDPLLVMEDALESAQPRASLRGLAKAFQVLEQAAINLHVCPWRKEYRTIKTYSSVFIHDVSPVLPPPQVRSLFGLLGYGAAAARPEQLRLAPPGDAPSPPDLLRLACAFFMARCECCLLLGALGKRAGELEWELSLVRERRRGNTLQVALDNTIQSLDVAPPPADTLDGDVDLYGDDQTIQPPPPAGERLSPHAVAPDDTPGGEPPSPGGGSERRACGESRSEAPDGERRCGCLLAPQLRLQHCCDCDITHDACCASLDVCKMADHRLERPGSPTASATLRAASPANQPISFHDCCEVSRPDPRLLCDRCRVFHSDACRSGADCLSLHGARRLGVCVCGQACPRAPLVLCRYCGSEYCRDCWYRNPITCRCGQTFDQSTPV